MHGDGFLFYSQEIIPIHILNTCVMYIITRYENYEEKSSEKVFVLCYPREVVGGFDVPKINSWYIPYHCRDFYYFIGNGTLDTREMFTTTRTCCRCTQERLEPLSTFTPCMQEIQVPIKTTLDRGSKPWVP